MIEIVAITLLCLTIMFGIIESVRINNKLLKTAMLAGLFATRYSFKDNVNIEARGQKDNTRKWSIVYFGSVFNFDTNNFEYEPIPSSRDEDFIRRTRFDSFEEAYKCYLKMVRPIVQKDMEELEKLAQKRRENLAKTKTNQSSPTINT